jgi:hypothetical protein
MPNTGGGGGRGGVGHAHTKHTARARVGTYNSFIVNSEKTSFHIHRNRAKKLRPQIISARYTDKIEEKRFLIYKEIQSEAVAKSHMRKGFLI